MKRKRNNKTPWWKIAGSLLLAISMFAYTGITAVTTMQCIYSGEQTVSMGNGDSCCEMTPATKTTVHAKCCNVHKGEFTFVSFKTLHEDLIPAVFSMPVKQVFAFAERLTNNNKPEYSNFIHGPPLPGRLLLINICKHTL